MTDMLGWEHILWVVLFVPILVAQLWAIVHHQPAMLSRTVWAGLRAWWFRIPFFALWFWLTWHWFVEYLFLPHLRGDWVSDVLVVMFGGVIGLLAVPIADEVDADE